MKLTVTAEMTGWRADRALCALAGHLNRRLAKLLFRDHLVRLNGKIAPSSARVQADNIFELPAPESELYAELSKARRAPRLATPHGRQLARLYEDEALLVLNKPAEVPVQRGADGLTRRDTLEDALARTYRTVTPPTPPFQGGEKESSALLKNVDEEGEAVVLPPLKRGGRGGDGNAPGFFFVHRLDMETSGCLLIAKNPQVRDVLLTDFAERKVCKQYLALVTGEVSWENLVVKRPIAYLRPQEPPPAHLAKKAGLRGLKVSVALEEGSAAGKASETRFTVLARYRGYTWLRAEPKTGRTHQIRVHLAVLGYPLAYDPLYGRRSPIRFQEFNPRLAETAAGEKVVLNRLPLHAWKLSLSHPVSGRALAFEAPLPRDLKEFLKILKKFRKTVEGPKCSGLSARLV